jgi:HlyD family secretion protein
MPILAAIVFGVVALLVLGFRPQPVLVDQARVQRAAMEVVVEEEGRTRVRERFEISAPLAGYLRRIVVEPGDPVAEDQVLALVAPMRAEPLDPRRRAQAEAQVAGARAAVRSAENRVRALAAEAEFAASEVARLRRLAIDGNVSRVEVERAEVTARTTIEALEEAEERVEVVRQELNAAQTQLAFAGEDSNAQDIVTVRSPIEGRILRRHRESEGVVMAGERLLEIADVDVLEVETDVLSADAVRIRPGQSVRFARWGGQPELDGVVTRVEPAGFTKVSALGVEEQRVWVISEITAEREAWRALGDGFRVESRFVVWAEADVLQVPSAAVFRHDNGWAVFRIEEARARLVPVRIGERSALRVQVLEGLAEGDQVVPHPPDQLQDGSRIRH